jgi:O-6-methylguanine DNA methyltransferase
VKHLTLQQARAIVKYQLTDENEIICFQHWYSCPKCQQMLTAQLHRYSFYQPTHQEPQAFLESVAEPVPIVLATTSQAVLALRFGLAEVETLSAELRQKGFRLGQARFAKFPQTVHSAVIAYLKHGDPLPALPLQADFIRSVFDHDVLSWTRLIPYGKTVSYGQLARWLNKPGAARAVGGAMHRNPLPLLIPCHRVVGSRGELTGFGGGLKLKAQLLSIEQKQQGIFQST